MRHFLRSAVLMSAAAGGLRGQIHLPGLSGGSSTPKVKSPDSAKPPESKPPESAPPAAAPGVDYYVLSISWPSGKPVVTGFAPGANDKRYPESCNSVKPASKGAMSIVGSLMLSQTAIQKEWMKHGSCTGFTAAEYFNALRYARSLVQIPVQLTSPDEDAPRETPQLIDVQFTSANPGFPAGAFRAGDSAVDVCFDAVFKPRECPATGSKSTDSK